MASTSAAVVAAVVVVMVALSAVPSCDQRRSGEMKPGSPQRPRDAGDCAGGAAAEVMRLSCMKLLKSRRLLLLGTEEDDGRLARRAAGCGSCCGHCGRVAAAS